MTFYTFVFYLLAAVIVSSTALAITRRNLVHTILYLVFSFLGTAMLFYLFGAPLLAAFQVIIYAGAIMVLFLFIVMMIRLDSSGEKIFPLNQLFPAALFGLIYLTVGVLIIGKAPGGGVHLKPAVARPAEFGYYVMQRHWLSVEIISVLLLVGLIGVLYLGGQKNKDQTEDKS